MNKITLRNRGLVLIMLSIGCQSTEDKKMNKLGGEKSPYLLQHKDNPIHLFTKGYRLDGRFVCASGEGKLCGSYIESDDKSGLASKIEAFQL